MLMILKINFLVNGIRSDLNKVSSWQPHSKQSTFRWQLRFKLATYDAVGFCYVEIIKSCEPNHFQATLLYVYNYIYMGPFRA